MKGKLPGFAIFFSHLIISSLLQAGQPYSLQDLEILSKEDNFEEFFQHAKDLRPSKRNQYWAEMVQNMAIKFLNVSTKKKNFEAGRYHLVLKIAKWPLLKKHEFFQVKYNQYAKQYIKHCLINLQKKDCPDKALQLWKLSNQDPDLGHQLASAIQGFYPRHNVWPFIKSIPLGPMAKFYCHRRPLATELAKELFTTMRPIIIPGKTTPSAKQKQIEKRLASLMNIDCWLALLPHLKELLLKENPRHQMILFKLLDGRQALTANEADFFYTVYLLRGPLIGEAFNRAWNNLVKIGLDFGRRTALLKKLQEQDPLEGKVFASKNRKLQKMVTLHLHRNFPEYLDYYSSTCLEYMEGKKIFPYGNPTLECRELFKIAQGTKWITQPLQLRFSGLLKQRKRRPLLANDSSGLVCSIYLR